MTIKGRQLLGVTPPPVANFWLRACLRHILIMTSSVIHAEIKLTPSQEMVCAIFITQMT